MSSTSICWLFRHCLMLLFFVSPLSAQYGFGVYPDSFYSTPQFGSGAVANPYNDFTNATKADENAMAFAAPFIAPSIVYVREDLWSNGDQGYTYERYDMFGVGSFWQIVTGQPSLYIDLRQIPGVSPSRSDLSGMGVVFESNGSVTISLTYYSEINEPEVIHAHGILGGWWTDGVPYLNTPVINRDETQTLAYNIDPNTNSGTYFLHSHYGFNSLHGVAAPLIIQYNVSNTHTLANIINDPNTQEIMFYAEDWCIQYSNADDALNGDDDDIKDFTTHFDPFLCQDPYLTMRALYGEWNSDKGAVFLGNDYTKRPPKGEGELHMCVNGTIAPEFGSAFFLANDRTYNDAYMQYVYPNSHARLRVINAARMTNFLLRIPQELQPVVIAVDGSYVKPVNMSAMPTPYEIWVGIAQRVDILLTIPVVEGLWNIIALQEMPDVNTSSKPAFAPYQVSLTAGIMLYSTYYPPPDTGIPPNASGTGMLSVYPNRIISQEELFTVWPDSASLDISHAKQVQLSLTGYNGIFGMDFSRGLEFPPMRSMDDFVALYNKLSPLVTVQHNDVVCINMTNYSWDTHPMHLHGHKFQVREINGHPFTGAIRDTVLVPAGRCQSVNICFQANQTAGGQFGLHCHMVIHEMAGMFSVIQYGNGVGLQGIQSNVVPTNPVCPSTDDTSTKEKIGLSLGLVLGLLLIVSVILNAVLYHRVRNHATKSAGHERVPMTIANTQESDE